MTTELAVQYVIHYATVRPYYLEICDSLSMIPRRYVVCCLREWRDLRAAHLHAKRPASTRACILMPCPQRCRFDREQEALLGVQDKVLAGLRAVSSWLTPDLHRPVRAALLPLVAQSGFIKKVAYTKISVLNTTTRVLLPSLVLN